MNFGAAIALHFCKVRFRIPVTGYGGAPRGVRALNCSHAKMCSPATMAAKSRSALDKAAHVRRVVSMRWGWPDPRNWKVPRLIHARSETIDTTSAFASAFRDGQRGIVIVRTFNEAFRARPRSTPSRREIGALWRSRFCGMNSTSRRFPAYCALVSWSRFRQIVSLQPAYTQNARDPRR
jgi:hypothetical protein